MFSFRYLDLRIRFFLVLGFLRFGSSTQQASLIFAKNYNMPGEVHYHDYLQLDKILNAQFPESEKHQLSGERGQIW